MPRGRALKLKVQLYRGADPAFGPGRADVLAAIDQEGSIRAAARSLGMSYRFVWRLVESMNQSFRAPLVEAATGGSRGGGTVLTETGHQVLSTYRRLEKQLMRAVDDEPYKALEALLAPHHQDAT